ncbi:two-component system response regulator RR class I (RRI)-CheY [Synechococcus sp. BIOS-U3-1]|uniref:response regulator n=1 Tax=Synechococcus sp. BIOS-U3-1 TaxID=1400865 RepID=UPI001646C05B|nr:response regulator [Synechococcus sp. BIOS-U3-1]QNI58560.1 two-component system response regulator RR class I (RRI)-CheY [Synechococcus sp. BIOS-U3-1]|tara:strand:+ start:6281 stop:6664 length:384 start_codon:yes stop_codon:yes gene_type:complete
MDDKPRVAFVDDDPRLRTLIAEELFDEGVHPLACSTGQELLDCLNLEKIDLILLDLMMPVMDGLTCLRHLKEKKTNIPILVVTAFNDDEKRQVSMENGAVDYIIKPDLFERLPELLDRHLKKPRNVN